ncbi:poly(U)-specific endoribonuclease homolog [Aphidius gifuensis]|uniref:poly(U)-specific endoribonuclease homolog n=1 Tax=Aphidius gifuensis TaxID=684658 RepID=UPI001CDC77D1|nr:poly(U)-specific endoribonuclease homolog [Aphidius gifuensis]
MTSKKIIFILLITLLSLFIEDTDAGWKFWKKDKKDDVSTPTPDITSSTISTTSTTTPTTPTKPSSNSKSGSATKAIAGAADPGLAIGVGNTGTLIKNNPQPKKPNPGTEVGLDFPNSKPTRPGVGGNNGQGYRDFILDLTGTGEPGKLPPKLPSQPPALAPSVTPTTKKPSGLVQPVVTPKPAPTQPQLNQGGQTPKPSLPVSPSQQPAVTPKPTSSSVGINQPIPGQNNKAIHPAIPDKPQVSTLNIGPLVPTVPPTSTTGGKSWAEIAGSGGKITSTTTTPISIINPGRLPSTQTSTSAYSSNPTYSKGNQVTDDDLVKLSEALFIKDANNAYRYINLNLQKQTTGSNKKDESPQPLFTVNSQAFNIPTIAKVITIYDNYKLDTRENEYISPAQRNEESLLVDTFLSTNVMSAAMRFLADKGFIAKDYYAYKDVLRKIWFNLYSRGDGKIGSSGFEHVFLTEIKLGTELTGLHNWIYFNAEEVKKRANYLGYIKKVDLGDKAAILSVHATFNGLDKPITTIFVGTSPELEMALYTVCFFVRSEKSCPVSLGGTKFNIITHKFKYRGNELIGSAYPEI